MNNLLTATITGDEGKAIRLFLRRDKDAYRWYEESGKDTEVSGDSIEDARGAAYASWRRWRLAMDAVTGEQIIAAIEAGFASSSMNAVMQEAASRHKEALAYRDSHPGSTVLQYESYAECWEAAARDLGYTGRTPVALNMDWDAPEFQDARELTELAGCQWDFEGWRAAANCIRAHGMLGGVRLGVGYMDAANQPA